MAQKLVILGTELKNTESLECHLNRLELRINEITNDKENDVFRNFRMKERIDFIKQERDVWKRNAETFKKMYSKLGK
jgi:hypothetical protein